MTALQQLYDRIRKIEQHTGIQPNVLDVSPNMMIALQTDARSSMRYISWATSPGMERYEFFFQGVRIICLSEY